MNTKNSKDKNVDTKAKRNLIIHSLNGGMFLANSGVIEEDEPIKEENLLKEIFKGNDLSEISFTRITNESFKDLAKMPEDVRIYFSSSTDDVWNYNPIISAYMGNLIYSPIIVFVSDNEMEENWGKERMPNDLFLNIVSGFIQICTEYAYNLNEPSGNSKTEAKSEPKKSPMFQLSEINFQICEIPEMRVKVPVKPGPDKKKLDEFWSQNYIGKYIADFVFNDLLYLDPDTNEYTKAYILMKPSIITLYMVDTGKVDLYINQYTREIFKNVLNKISDAFDDLDEKASEEDKKKVKDEIIQRIYS